MKARQWSIRRQTIPTADAQRRWDQAYQNLVRWSLAASQDRLQEAPQQEHGDESGDVCPRVYATAGTSTDH
ncbi:hypothetical protein KSC_102550 [Ktedonobacter sp. SOSP1-52]|uniref:hypothetical protein n=1 Tax=Ktedonobacter sp. SOSP1-52 TaxID=2778366 RepID=UPI0019169D89|nr:hypothetical protein [Ktedonobacter sp. SOSP1-52]GHO61315.1 hypothetical protein KSC_002070 [Ktedonobacter sp. SOSP1-52]GHO71363.1 hypothetical protein KSC_102550 [Ktedonobacter sp. SOSP1-52]